VVAFVYIVIMSTTEIFVKYNNRTLAVAITPDMTITQVKDLLAQHPHCTGTLPLHMRLIKGGTVMHDAQRLRDFNVAAESILHMVYRPPAEPTPAALPQPTSFEPIGGARRRGRLFALFSRNTEQQQQPQQQQRTAPSTTRTGGWMRAPYAPLPSINHPLPAIDGDLTMRKFLVWCTAHPHRPIGSDTYGDEYPAEMQPAVARPRCATCKQPSVMVDEQPNTSWADVFSNTVQGECFSCNRRVGIEYSFVCQGDLVTPLTTDDGRTLSVCKSESNRLRNSVLPNVYLCPGEEAYDGEEHLVQLVFHPCGHRMNANDVAAYISAQKRAAVVENTRLPGVFGKYVLRCCIRNCDGIAYLPTCKLAGPQLYNDMKNWGAVEAILEQGGVQCPMEHADGLRAFMPRADEPGPKVFCPSCNFDVCEEHAIPYHACAHSTGLTLRNEITNTMSAGMTQPCPGCSIVGQKDGACTHMTYCPCGTHWCYFCGKAEAQLDISPPDRRNRSRLYRHNDDAENNKNRCVWFLYRHPLMGGTPVESMAKFHRLKLMRLFKELRDARGAAEFDPVYETFTPEELTVEMRLDNNESAPVLRITLQEIIDYPPRTPYALP
jgi:hypothetical protein